MEYTTTAEGAKRMLIWKQLRRWYKNLKVIFNVGINNLNLLTVDNSEKNRGVNVVNLDNHVN